MSLTHLPDSQIRNLSVLENLTLKNDLVFNNKLVVNDTTDGDVNTGSIKTSGGLSVAKNLYANSLSLPNVNITGGSGLSISNGVGISGVLNVEQYTILGDNVAIKMKPLSETIPSSANASVNIAHGLDWLKIVSVNVM